MTDRIFAPSGWPHFPDLLPCPECNEDSKYGTCGDWWCDLCTFGDCKTCGGLGWRDPDMIEMLADEDDEEPTNENRPGHEG